MSFLAPSFLARLEDPSIKTVFMTGCGGGFDFAHCMVLYPELMRLGKKVVIGSYSFGSPRAIRGAEVVREEPIVVRATAACQPDPRYGPEVGMCAFLDKKFPTAGPHSVYAYYARDFTVAMLKDLYQGWVAEHAIDAVVLIDGGSDSLMAGDECGLGDPIEDCVSVVTCSELEGVRVKLLVAVGVGCDRFNDVPDAATLRAVAELSKAGGFLGSLSLEPQSAGFLFYSECVEFMQERAAFRSVIANSIIAAGEGNYGYNVPASLRSRVGDGQLYLWPLMSMLWVFDPCKVAERSFLAKHIRGCATVPDMYAGLSRMRNEVTKREVEDLPRHRNQSNGEM